ncbi:maestro heat-like repeat-containing protein family member 7 [Balearica regulorum gibbericeps]|uniref:maestro heat-like repeat-containing protein family member 7 n=1 Tax=Balearica regulorum gibbericeps TaxID=100784 RepID=UPI003F5E9346
MEFLLPRFTELLQDADGEVVRMTLSVLRRMLLTIDIPIASPIALPLAEALRPLFDNESSYVQLLSIRLFRNVMEFVSEAGKKPLEAHVQQSLLPLLYHLHDENQRVAEASQETMLQAATFLKKRKLTRLLKRQQTWAVGECLLTEPSSRADEYVLQSLLYLQSPQESTREAAVRFIGLAGRRMRYREKELQIIYNALQGMTNDISPSVSNLAAQTLLLLRGTERRPSFGLRLQVLQDQLHRAWHRRPSLQDSGWLCCWSSVQR